MNYQKRLQRIREVIKHKGCDALLVDDAVNIFYLTGLKLSAGSILISHHDAVLLVDGRYEEMCRKNARMKVALVPQTTLKEAAQGIKTLGFNSESLSYKTYQELEKQLGDVTLVPLENCIREIRGIKEADEIRILKEAGELGAKGYDYVCTLLREGITESEVAQELDIFWKKQGGQGLAFEPIIAFGANSSMPHYRASKGKLEKGQPIQIDIGVIDRQYHSDMSRVVFFGEPSTEMRKIYAIVLKAQLAALEKCAAGTKVGELDQTARDIISEAGYGDKFTHSLGHGVGLEIHEYPLLRNKAPYNDVILQSGMVITVEPGIYLPGIGGVRIEDTVVITDDGYENLTNRSKELLVVH